MTTALLLLATALVVAGLVAVAWRMWSGYARISRREKLFENRVASLNDRQANRLSDSQLRQKLSPDDAWRLMVERGRSGRDAQPRPARRSGSPRR